MVESKDFFNTKYFNQLACASLLQSMMMRAMVYEGLSGVSESHEDLGFIVHAILGIMWSRCLLHLGALSVRLSECQSEVKLCLVSCSCEYCGSVPSYLVSSWSVNGGQE